MSFPFPPKRQLDSWFQVLSVKEMRSNRAAKLSQGITPDAQLSMFAGLERTENTLSEDGLSNARAELQASEYCLKGIN
jgi:hypothetical protein